MSDSEKDYWDLLEDENLLEQFTIGAITSGIAQSGVVPGMKKGSLIETTKQGRDFISGLNAQEQTVVDKEAEKRIAEKEKNGTELSNKEKNEIYEKVLEDLEVGKISLETIEEALGGDNHTAYHDIKAESEEFKSLYETEGGKLSEKQRDRLAELKAKNTEKSYEERLKEVGTKLASDTFNLAKDGKLEESYREAVRKTQKLEADLGQYKSETAKKTAQNLVNSGLFDNTRDSHAILDLATKLSEEKGYEIDVADVKGIEESVKNGNPYNITVDPKRVEALVNKDKKKILINVEANKSLNSLLGHEITHTLKVLSNPKRFKKLQEAAIEYAKAKGEYEERKESVERRYNGIEADINEELTADICGDYLMTDYEFVKHLATTDRNLFQKIFDEIKYLCKIVTAGSEAARKFETLKHNFEKAYRESGETSGADEGASIKYSIKKTSKMPYNEQLNLIEKGQMNGSNSLYAGKPSEQLQTAGFSNAPFAMNQGDYKKSRRASAKNKNYSSHAVPYDFFEEMPQHISNAPLLIDNGAKVTVVTSYGMKDTKGKDSYVIAGVLMNQQMENDTVNQVKSAYPLDDFAERILSAAESGKLVVTNKKKADQMLATIGIQPSEVSRIINLSKDIITQNSEKSSTDTNYSLSEEQQESFKDSVVRDDSGNVIPLSERFNSDSDDIRYSLAENTVDKYSQKQYNDFGWARYSEAISKNELDDMYSKIHTKGSLAKFKKSSDGEAIIEVNDKPHTTLGVDNVFVFVTGTKNNPKINKVVRFQVETDTEMEIIKEKLYERGSFSNTYYSFLKQEGFAREYSKKSAIDYLDYNEKVRRGSIGKESNGTDGISRIEQDGKRTPKQTQSNEIAPSKQASSNDGVFFDGKLVVANKKG